MRYLRGGETNTIEEKSRMKRSPRPLNKEGKRRQRVTARRGTVTCLADEERFESYSPRRRREGNCQAQEGNEHSATSKKKKSKEGRRKRDVHDTAMKKEEGGLAQDSRVKSSRQVGSDRSGGGGKETANGNGGGGCILSKIREGNDGHKGS